MADFTQDKKYSYVWQSSKFKDLAFSGSNISQFVNDAGYVTSTSGIDTGSFVTTSSFNVYTGSSSSQFAGTASLALTASYFSGSVSNAISASYALNGGVTQLLAGPNVTLSPTNGLGQVTVSATLSGSTIFNTATGSYGSFYDTTTQTNPVANIARSMSFNSTDITNGVSISGSTSPFNTYIKTTNAGVYNIQFLAQVDKTDGGTDDIVIWLRKNGLDLTDTATTLTLPTNNSKVVAAWNWFVTSAANDYYQIIWRSDDTDLRLLAEPISVNHPGIPSVIATVNRVDQFLSNTGSFSGSFTGVFTGSLQGTASFSTSASFASTVPASGVIGLNLSQIATGSVTASVSPTQFTVTSGSSTELTVTGTGVTLGNALTDTHRVTGSANITGSLTVVGSTTSTQIGAGAAPTGSVRLDVRAQGALSTDIALRVRNSTDTYNMLAVQGDGNIQIGSDAVGTTRTTTIAASNTSQLVLDTSFSTDTATISVARRITPLYNTNTLLFTQNSFSDGNVQPYRFHFVNPSTYWGYNQAGWTVIYDAGYMWHKDSATFANLQMKLTPDNVLTVYTGSVTPSGPTGTSAIPTEANITGSAFQLWASGSAGNAQPYFKTQNGTIVWLGAQSRLFNVTASSIISSGSITVGNITSTPSTENTLNVYPPLVGGTGEGGQILLAASGGLYTSASMLDTWQNYFRILRGTNTGGSNAQLLGLDLQTGNLSIAGAVIPSAWTAGQVIKDTMLSNTEVTVSTTTIATSGTDTDFVTYNYTPVSSNSYLIIHYHLASYDFSGGTGNDSYISRIKVDGSEITYGTQSTVNGNRTGVLFPLTGRYTNSNTTAKSIVVACRRNSADDSITIVNSSTSMWLRITEIGR
jgi:hypothetical protein